MTSAPARGVLDTSVFIASESGRPLDESMLPDESAICVVTLAELQAGVLAAPDVQTRARRMATVQAAAELHVLEVERFVGLTWAYLRVQLAKEGRRANVNDLWIAAIALSHDLPVITQDADFAVLDGVADLQVVRV